MLLSGFKTVKFLISNIYLRIFKEGVMQKAGRNDPCPCGSGKKYKKCCELKVTHRFTAHKIESSVLNQQASTMTNLFMKRVIETPSEMPVIDKERSYSQDAVEKKEASSSEAVEPPNSENP
jgi:hypothetical protein